MREIPRHTRGHSGFTNNIWRWIPGQINSDGLLRCCQEVKRCCWQNMVVISMLKEGRLPWKVPECWPNTCNYRDLGRGPTLASRCSNCTQQKQKKKLSLHLKIHTLEYSTLSLLNINILWLPGKSKYFISLKAKVHDHMNILSVFSTGPAAALVHWPDYGLMIHANESAHILGGFLILPPLPSASP